MNKHLPPHEALFDDIIRNDWDDEDNHHKVQKEGLEQRLRMAMLTLTPKEMAVIDLRYWDRLTLRKVGSGCGYNGPERIRQIINKALRKLRHPHRFKFIVNPHYLKSFSLRYAYVFRNLLQELTKLIGEETDNDK